MSKVGCLPQPRTILEFNTALNFEHFVLCVALLGFVDGMAVLRTYNK